jgi:hypothetical protein
VLIKDERCQECGRDFQTGEKLPVICWQCERKETAEKTACYAQPTFGHGRGDINLKFRPIGSRK